MPIYKKLVRDYIPNIIRNSGKDFNTRILAEDEYKVELQKKLKEELQEYFEANKDASSIEELADILEIIHTLTIVHKSSVDELEQVRREKAVRRGGFQERIYLINVEDE